MKSIDFSLEAMRPNTVPPRKRTGRFLVYRPTTRKGPVVIARVDSLDMAQSIRGPQDWVEELPLPPEPPMSLAKARSILRASRPGYPDLDVTVGREFVHVGYGYSTPNFDGKAVRWVAEVWPEPKRDFRDSPRGHGIDKDRSEAIRKAVESALAWERWARGEVAA